MAKNQVRITGVKEDSQIGLMKSLMDDETLPWIDSLLKAQKILDSITPESPYVMNAHSEESGRELIDRLRAAGAIVDDGEDGHVPTPAEKRVVTTPVVEEDQILSEVRKTTEKWLGDHIDELKVKGDPGTNGEDSKVKGDTGDRGSIWPAIVGGVLAVLIAILSATAWRPKVVDTVAITEAQQSAISAIETAQGNAVSAIESAKPKGKVKDSDADEQDENAGDDEKTEGEKLYEQMMRDLE